MKQASLLERFRFSYTYALLHESFRYAQARFLRTRKLQFTAAMPVVKNRTSLGPTGSQAG